MNVLSFSLWGGPSKYTEGAEQQPRYAARHYPDWQCRFYTDRPRPELEDLGAEVIVCGLNGFSNIFRRLNVLTDPTVDRAIFRDVNKVITAREAAAVEDWAAEGTRAHGMHDSMYHGDFPLMGGMWGLWGGLPDLEALKQAWLADPFRHGKWWPSLGEECFIEAMIYPLVAESCLIHSSINVKWKYRAFPEGGVEGEFVGMTESEMAEAVS